MEYHIKTLDQLRPILVGLRKQAGLSQMAVASLLGVSQQSYAKIEANPSATSIERLFKILKLLGSDIILSERMPSADRSQPGGEDTPPVPPQQGSGKPNVSSSAPITNQLSRKNGKKSPSAPAKLIPPSKKTESW